MTARAEDRDAQVRALAEALGVGPFAYTDWAQKTAERLYDAGARIPAPPAPVNPVSRETALAIYEHFNGGESTPVNPRVTRLQEALHAAAPALVRDLAEAAKKSHGYIELPCTSGLVHPDELVRALCPPAGNGA